MDTAHLFGLRIAFVSTRDLSERNGRTPILSHILRTLSRNHVVEVLHLRSLLEAGGIRDFAGAVLYWLGSLARGRPIPLQCLLYASPRESARLIEQIRQSGCSAVYLDTVRCQVLLRALRRAVPDLHVVTDFDDLMSRRAAHLARNRQPFLAGHAGPHFPRWLRYLAEAPLARFITTYEAATLPAAEDEVVAASDATVVLSAAEQQMLRWRAKPSTTTLLCAIPPAFAVQALPWRSAPTLRFIFIGSDNQLQNRTAIDFLLNTWRILRPTVELHIYGRQDRPTEDVAGVRLHGFVEGLPQVYLPGSIALVPALIPGGIKTKVAEAWAWGCPVLGNKAALEGLAIAGYPLALPESEWSPYLQNPSAYTTVWAHAARLGHAFVRHSLSPESFERAWEEAMHPVRFNTQSFASSRLGTAMPQAGQVLR